MKKNKRQSTLLFTNHPKTYSFLIENAFSNVNTGKRIQGHKRPSKRDVMQSYSFIRLSKHGLHNAYQQLTAIVNANVKRDIQPHTFRSDYQAF